MWRLIASNVTVQICYSSPWTLWSSLVISEGWLVYWRDRFISMLWVVFRIWTEKNCLVLLTFSWDDRKGTRSPRGESVVFRRCEFCFVNMRSCLIVSSEGYGCTLNERNNRSHMWDSEFSILGTVLFSKVVMWLVCADCMMNFFIIYLF
jgi:hypothetical protein